MNAKTLLISSVFLSLFFFSSCNNRSTTVKSRESYVYNEQVWFLLKYANGTYGAEIGDEVILNNCENEIYMQGYDGDYVFVTQRGRDRLYYNLSGKLLFIIPDAEFSIVMGYHDGTKMRNGYVLAEDYEDKESVYSLDGKRIISPQDCYFIGNIVVKLDNGTRALWGFDVNLKSDRQDIYTYDGDFVVSGKTVVDKANCACPIFSVEKDKYCYALYNYKGQKIINDTDKYWDYDIDYDNYGCPYIVCETEYAADHYYGRDDRLWISMNGEILKEEGYNQRVDYNIRSEERREYNNAKNELKNRINQLPKFNAPYSSGSSATGSGSHGYSDNSIHTNHPSPGYDNNPNVTGYQNPTTNNAEDNSRWVSYYRDNYNRYAELVKRHASTLSTLISTGNGGPTSSYAISEVKSKIKDAQRDMARLRNEAQQKGIHIDASPLEYASY